MSEFGNLLRAFRARSFDAARGRPLTQERLGELVGQELNGAGYTGAAVSEWERGESRINHEQRRVLVSLIKVLRQCGGIRSITEANTLLQTGKYSQLDNDERLSVFPAEEQALPPALDTTAEPAPSLWPPDIPDEPYYALPSQERMLSELASLLVETHGPPVIAVDGLGGLGKTALAVELARRALRQQQFEGLIGDSAKQEILTGGQIVQVREATLDLNSLLDALARQLKHWEWLTLKVEEKRAALAYLFSQHRYLVLVDNLETSENAEALVAHLKGILGRSQAVITSRKRVRHDFVHALSLTGLQLEDALVFLRTDAAHRGVQQLLQAPEEKLIEIHTLTGGAPLAMKLVVAQAKFIELEAVLKQLRSAGGQLYPFIFRQSWEQLSLEAQRTLIYIGRTVVTTVSWEELASVEIAEGEDELIGAVDQLIAYSLLNVSPAVGQMRYSIHQLTRQFVNSDLPELWRSQGLL